MGGSVMRGSTVSNPASKSWGLRIHTLHSVGTVYLCKLASTIYVHNISTIKIYRFVLLHVTWVPSSIVTVSHNCHKKNPSLGFLMALTIVAVKSLDSRGEMGCWRQEHHNHFQHSHNIMYLISLVSESVLHVIFYSRCEYCISYFWKLVELNSDMMLYTQVSPLT